MTFRDESVIRHQPSNRIDTFRGVKSSAPTSEETGGPAYSTNMDVPTSSPDENFPHDTRQPYVAPMTTSITTVIDAIEARRPGLSDTKRNLLLFFCQGHQLAHSGDALFAEALYATDHGVDLADVPVGPSGDPLTPGQLNTVADALNRYGDLSPADLRTLIQASVPWQLAIKSTLGSRIEWAWLRDWFRRPDETEDLDDSRPTQSRIATWRSRSTTR